VTALKIERDYITARRRDQPSHIILKLKTQNNYNNARLTPRALYNFLIIISNTSGKDVSEDS
jgi:hypothetical protein